MTEEAKIENNFEDINKTVKYLMDAFKTKNSSGELYVEEVWTKREALGFKSEMLADFLFHHLSVSDWSVEKSFWKDVIVMAKEPKIKITRDLALYDISIDSSRCFQEVALSLEKDFILGFFGIILQDQKIAVSSVQEKNQINESVNIFSNKICELLRESAENEIDLDVKASPFPVNFSSSSSMWSNLKISFYDINLYNADLDFEEGLIKTDKTNVEYVAGIKPAINIVDLEKIVKTAISFTNNHFVKTYNHYTKNLIFTTITEINKIAKVASRGMDVSILDTYIRERHLNKFVKSFSPVEHSESEHDSGNSFKI